MIRSFRHKGLSELYLTGAGGKVQADLRARALRVLDALANARILQDLRAHAFGFHTLQGKPKRYALTVNGPWRITFEWRKGDAWRVDLEQYH